MRTYIYKNRETGKTYSKNEMAEFMKNHEGMDWEKFFVRVYFSF